MNIQKTDISTKTLDDQSVVDIAEWVVVDSIKHKEMDEYYSFCKDLLKKADANSFLRIDNLGRIWVLGPNMEMYPYHFEKNRKYYGLRIPAVAAN